MTILQVQKEHYDFFNYVTWYRWQSYFVQVSEVLKKRPETLLIIGPGDGIVTDILKKHGIKVFTLDIDASLSPDFVGNLSEAPSLIGSNFDMVMCCQVLEHMELDFFEEGLNILKKLSKKHVIISLPYRRFSLSFFLFLPFSKKISFILNIPRNFNAWKFDGEHFWEVGIKGVSRKFIIRTIEKFFRVTKTFQVKENPYHLFYICEI